MTGSKKDAEHPAAVAASIFTAVVIYAVRFYPSPGTGLCLRASETRYLKSFPFITPSPEDHITDSLLYLVLCRLLRLPGLPTYAIEPTGSHIVELKKPPQHPHPFSFIFFSLSAMLRLYHKAG